MGYQSWLENGHNLDPTVPEAYVSYKPWSCASKKHRPVFTCQSACRPLLWPGGAGQAWGD